MGTFQMHSEEAGTPKGHFRRLNEERSLKWQFEVTKFGGGPKWIKTFSTVQIGKRVGS